VNGLVVGAEVRWTGRIIALAARHRLPAVYALRQNVDEGGLIAWDIDRLELFRRGAYLVDRILKGAKPAELPFEQPTKFELAVNSKTAKTLGLTIPPPLLLRATHMVE
jgi:putative ABC transport system substrate-binding protein